MDIPIYTQAVLVEDGIIKMVGERDSILQHVTPQTRIENLNGSTLLPGFIDSHSHISAFVQTLGVVQLSDCKSFAEIAAKLTHFRDSRHPGGRDWIIGFGYDHRRLAEKQHPDKRLLDATLPGYRILISHVSGRMGVMSSIGMVSAGISASTPNPDDGVIGRCEDGVTPNGYLEGSAFMQASAELPPPSEDQLITQIELAQKAYAQHGITTVQEGKAREDEWAMLRTFSDAGRLFLDVNCYIDLKESKHIAQENLSRLQRYKRHLKVGGYSLSLDGLPQDCTAWMTAPYSGQRANQTGKQIYSDEEVRLLLFEALGDHLPVIAHCCGDAAIDQLLSCYEHLTGGKDLGLRPVVLQGQFMRPDQIPRMATLGAIASFFIAHTYFWGDAHIQNFGIDRARLMMPTGSAKQLGIPFTFHQDTPLLLPNMLSSIWCAVNRVTRGGVQLDETQQISIIDALRAVTYNAAYQCFEEDSKGSISVGKRADFVILDNNPLRVRPADLKRIRVMKTIKDDKVVYER